MPPIDTPTTWARAIPSAVIKPAVSSAIMPAVYGTSSRCRRAAPPRPAVAAPAPPILLRERLELNPPRQMVPPEAHDEHQGLARPRLDVMHFDVAHPDPRHVRLRCWRGAHRRPARDVGSA